MSYSLRPYQQECLDSIAAAAARGVRRQLAVMATGMGKTVVFSHLLERLGLRGRMLVLAHRRELLDQAAAKLRPVNPDLSVEVEQGARRGGQADVVVASVQTLGTGGKRLAQLNPHEFDLVVVDEAHHAIARSYLRVLEHFGIVRVEGKDIHPTDDPASPLLVGVTATPMRGDNVGLSAVFQEVVYEMDLRAGVADGWLCPIRAWRIETEADLRGLKTTNGDFVVSELAERVNRSDRNLLAVRAYEACGNWQRALVFCVDVAHAVAVADAFCEEGIPSAAVSGSMGDDRRADTLARFSRGELLVLTNCQVLTEGYDEPSVGCLIMARPTKSVGLYLQMVGRGTRLAPGKTHVAVVDMADLTSHALPSTASILGLPPRWDCKGRDVLRQVEALTEISREAPRVLERAVSLEDAQRLMREVDILGDTSLLKELRRLSQFAWSVTPSGSVYYLSLPGGRVITAREDMLGRWHVTLSDPDRQAYSGDLVGAPWSAQLGMAPPRSREEAVWFADAYVRRFLDAVVPVVRSDARWRKEPATDGQERALRRVHRWRDGITKGEAKDILDAVFNRKRITAG